ncbi:MAG: polysaccharide deacetylase family protein [Chitinispirillaceae bacterium]|nr:polysaccharide deacetylase family protein [Chitinispirillaceae bacterium]
MFIISKRQNISSLKGFVFHNITQNLDIQVSNYSLKKFKGFCKYLKENSYISITLSEAYFLDLSNKKNNILITFDDGLSSVYQYALPVLLEYNIKATVFCTSGFIGKKSNWDIFSYKVHLNKEEIRNLSKNGIEIGSHTKTHPYLPYLTDSEIFNELNDSKKELEDIIGKEVTSISFPFGGFNKKIWEIAKKVGYKDGAIYRGKSNPQDRIYKVYGVYSFDSVQDLIEKVNDSYTSLFYTVTSEMMSHFSKGTPLWRFRKSYNLF